MRCTRARTALSAYLDGELGPRRRVALEAHLEGCRACSAELERWREQWEALGGVDPPPPVPPALWKGILTALEEPWHRRYRARLLQAACVAACVVLGFAGGVMLSWPGQERPVLSERRLVSEAFDVTAFGSADGKGGMLQCAPR